MSVIWIIKILYSSLNNNKLFKSYSLVQKSYKNVIVKSKNKTIHCTKRKQNGLKKKIKW